MRDEPFCDVSCSVSYGTFCCNTYDGDNACDTPSYGFALSGLLEAVVAEEQPWEFP
jgi:hypothetical protein